MTGGTFILGGLDGLITALLAVGLVLVYKSNKFLNLAHAQLGALSALLLRKFVVDWGWSWWFAAVIAVGVGVATGLLVERFAIAPLRRRTKSPITLLLMTLGISQLLLALAYIPAFLPKESSGGTFPQPFGATVRVGGVVLSGMDVLTAIVVPLLVAALALFMRFSPLGKQIRAAANNPDAARLCGISVHKVSAVTWGVAGGFSAVSAILAAPRQPSFGVEALGPYLLMLTLGAAALGAFVSVPAALGGGLLFGLVGQVVRAETSNASDAELASFLLILAIVVVRGGAIGRVFALSGAVTQDLPVTRVPASLRTSPVVKHQRLALTVGGLFLALVVPQLPYFDTAGHTFLLSLILLYATLGIALTMVLGWGGQVSLGHFAVVGLGAYLTARWAAHGWSLPFLCLVIGLVGAGTMVVIGLPALRVRGLTLTLTSLGFAVIAGEWLYPQSWVGTSRVNGLPVTPPRLGPLLGTPKSPHEVYLVALVLLTVTALAAGALRRSSPGRLILAVRDNERASSSFGVTPATVKLALLAVSGFIAGTVGVVWADAQQSLSLQQFPPGLSISLIAIPVIGGLGSVGGAVLASVLLFGGTYFLGPVVKPVFGSAGQSLAFTLALAGVGQVAVLLQAPTGLAGMVQRRWEAYLERRAQRTARASTGANSDVPLAVRGVRVTFGGIVAVNDVDIDVNPGEIVGLIGTNGAGKSTLVNTISGMIRPERGSIRVFGHEVVDLPADLRAGFGLGRTFQDASLFAGLTVLETIQVALAQRHKVGVVSALIAAPWVRSSERSTRKEAQDIVDRFGLTDWADTRASELSTGTRRICDLAAQVAARPRLVLLDEPTAGVAQREAEAFGPLLRRIREQLDCAILIVEHDMPLLMGLCDRVYALEAGAVIAIGSPEAIRNDPRVVASYLGTEQTAIDRSGRPTPSKAASRRPPSKHTAKTPAKERSVIRSSTRSPR